MLKLLKPKSRSTIGIDISSSSIKVIELTLRDDRYCVENYGVEPIAPGILEGNAVKDVDALSLSIKRLLTRTNMSGKAAVLAVPDSSVITKVVQVNEGLADNEIEEMILMEADKYIPYPIDEINMDFEVLGHSHKNASMLDVLIVASRSTNVSGRVDAVVSAGLDAKVVDVESFAVERAAQLLASDLPANGQDKIVAVIDIGAHFTHLFILNGMKMIFTREEEFGGKQLIDMLASHCGVNYEEARKMQQEGNLPEDYQHEVFEPFIEMLLLQIKRTLQFFYSTSQHGFVDHLILAGGIAMIPGLTERVNEFTNIPTTIANPFIKMNFANKLTLEQMSKEGPSLLIACGLALRTPG